MQVKVEIPNLKKLQDALRQYPRIAEPILQKAVEAGAFEVQKRAVRGTLPWRTGYLTQSFGLRPLIGRLFAIVKPTADYAIFVHEGTRPHEIRSKGPWPLRSKDGRIFGRKVNHPGTKPNRFLPRMLEEARNDVDRHFQAALERITAEIAAKMA